MFVLNYTITRAHVARLQKLVPHRFGKPNRASTWPSRIAIWIAAFLVSASLTMMFPTFVGKFAWVFVSILVGIVLGVGLTWAIALAMRKAVMSLREGGPTLGPVKTTVDDNGLHFSTQMIATDCRWPAVLEVTEQKDIVVVWIEAYHGFIIPSSAFANDAAVQAFLTFARDHVLAEKSSGFTPARQPKP